MLGLTGGGPGFTYHVDAIYAENLIAGGNALVLIGGTTRDYVTHSNLGTLLGAANDAKSKAQSLALQGNLGQFALVRILGGVKQSSIAPAGRVLHLLLLLLLVVGRI